MAPDPDLPPPLGDGTPVDALPPQTASEGTASEGTASEGTASEGTASIRARFADAVLSDDARPSVRRLVESLLATVELLARSDTDLIDLKIADAALTEMTQAFEIFRPYRGIRKVAIFGSARTGPGDHAYRQARALAQRVARSGWMVVTGAGPGIMAAGMEGAGTDRSLGVNIRLPFEQEPNQFIAQDPKLVSMRYFFTRKLMLIKETDAYVLLPGGFGTLDEGFELLTLLQTGKATPAPVVLLDAPGQGYWRSWRAFADNELVANALISPDDLALARITDSVDEATAELVGFYRNYQACRWVGDLLVIRMLVAPDRSELADLNRRFADLVTTGTIHPTRPLPPERSGHDHLDQPRLALRLDPTRFSRLRLLVDAINECTGGPGPAVGA